MGRVFLVVEEQEQEPDGTESRRGHGRPRRRKKQAHSCLRFADSGGDPLHSPMHLHLHCKSALQCNTPTTASVSIQEKLGTNHSSSSYLLLLLLHFCIQHLQEYCLTPATCPCYAMLSMIHLPSSSCAQLSIGRTATSLILLHTCRRTQTC